MNNAFTKVHTYPLFVYKSNSWNRRWYFRKLRKLWNNFRHDGNLTWPRWELNNNCPRVCEVISSGIEFRNCENSYLRNNFQRKWKLIFFPYGYFIDHNIWIRLNVWSQHTRYLRHNSDVTLSRGHQWRLQESLVCWHTTRPLNNV